MKISINIYVATIFIYQLQPQFGNGYMSLAKTNESFLEESIGNVEFTMKTFRYFIIIYELSAIHALY